MKKNMTKQEFKKWKDDWMKMRGCPFFTCAQALGRKVCNNSFICGCLTDYKTYKNGKWIRECNVKLTIDKKFNEKGEYVGEFPTKICKACTSSMCLKINHDNGTTVSQSPCKLMNNFYARKGVKVDRSLEKYILSWGAYLIPVIGVDAYLKLQSDPSIIEKIKNLKNKRKNDRKRN